MRKLAIHNEKCLVVLSITKQLVLVNDVKCWINSEDNEGYKILDSYTEIRTRLNYSDYDLVINSTANKEFVFTSDGRDKTYLIENLKFISYEN